MQEPTPENSGESGNVLFLILIAVVLFAALSFAITMSNRSGSDVNTDMVRVAASQIIQSGIDIEAGVLRLRVSQAVSDADISFENPMLEDYENPGCTRDQCRVFSPTGGQISYNKPHPEWLNRKFSTEPSFGEWLYTGTSCIPGQGTGNDAGCAGHPEQLELLAVLPYLTREICIELNKKLGVPLQPDGSPPQIAGSAWAGGGAAKFIGSYGNGEAVIDPGNILFGQPEGCFESNGTPPAGSYHFFRVVVAR